MILNIESAFQRSSADVHPGNAGLTRRFDAKAASLQRTGQLCTFPSSLAKKAATSAATRIQDPREDFPPSIPIATQATGVAGR